MQTLQAFGSALIVQEVNLPIPRTILIVNIAKQGSIKILRGRLVVSFAPEANIQMCKAGLCANHVILADMRAQRVYRNAHTANSVSI